MPRLRISEVLNDLAYVFGQFGIQIQPFIDILDRPQHSTRHVLHLAPDSTDIIKSRIEIVTGELPPGHLLIEFPHKCFGISRLFQPLVNLRRKVPHRDFDRERICFHLPLPLDHPTHTLHLMPEELHRIRPFQRLRHIRALFALEQAIKLDMPEPIPSGEILLIELIPDPFGIRLFPFPGLQQALGGFKPYFCQLMLIPHDLAHPLLKSP
ncbi:MAG: hypothetical protein BWY82_02894 [Verrucomicrobia bacterium ADurb.Bin474]|nr:MAG: hypothetical protein BWY82_02894 [Verrucomicrobia bacterium ADurb.Bin474]